MPELLELQAERTASQVVDGAALPVCPYGNLNGPVSLWDMLQFESGSFTRASSLLSQMYMEIRCGNSPTELSINVVGPELDLLERNCNILNLTTTLAQVRRAKIQLALFVQNRGPGLQHVASVLQEVVTRLNDELGSRVAYVLKAGQEQYCRAFTSIQNPTQVNSVEEAWEPVFNSFPKVKYDATEAFKSYAFGRNTACVFHLMRVLELGLSALGDVFGVSLAHTNWAPAIEQIESRIRDMHKDPSWKVRPDRKEQQEFYSQAASHFGILKDAWRNYTAHARGKYDEQEAYDILTSVRAFMQRLTTGGLHE